MDSLPLYWNSGDCRVLFPKLKICEAGLLRKKSSSKIHCATAVLILYGGFADDSSRWFRTLRLIVLANWLELAWRYMI
jgi:hypothetical protein